MNDKAAQLLQSRRQARASGQPLLSATSKHRRVVGDADADPVLLGFLSFLEKEMAHRPESIESADRAQIKRIGKLVRGVKID